MRLEHNFPKQVLSPLKVRGHILAYMMAAGKRTLTTAKQTTQSFEEVNVEWELKVRYAGGAASVSVTTDNEIYGYLNDGTDVRWAVMNNPFQPKTHPGEITPSSGVRTYNKRGYYTAIRGRRAMQKRNIQPRPGIKARNFTDTIVEFLQQDFRDNLDGTIARAMR
jgi:hypothetical protein